MTYLLHTHTSYAHTHVLRHSYVMDGCMIYIHAMHIHTSLSSSVTVGASNRTWTPEFTNHTTSFVNMASSERTMVSAVNVTA